MLRDEVKGGAAGISAAARTPGPTKPRFVVGLGASAGGLAALESFFAKAPTQSGGAFVVAMHLAPHFRSVLTDLIARRTTMPVRAAEDDLELAPDVVYVIQPNTVMEVDGLRLRVKARLESGQNRRLSSVDALFESIAASWGARGAAVVLSGSGSDGAKGVLAIHKAGGVAFAQTPETAEFDGMPIAAIASHSLSRVDTPERLAQTVVEAIFLPRAPPDARRSAAETQALQEILACVVGSSHLDASQYTHSAFERRVRRRMQELQIETLVAYARMVQANSEEARTLSGTLLVGVTDFFRDEAVFEALAKLVLPKILERAARESRPARVWVPGCASGEEAYTLAMLLEETAAARSLPATFQIFATDVHAGLLAEASRGKYAEDRLVNVSQQRRRAYFSRAAAGQWRVDPKLRKNVVFAPHDVLTDPAFTKLDLVSCRNLLIYFAPEAQQRVLAGFAFGLMESGYLLLGASETVGAQRECFDFVEVKQRLFQRNRAPARNILVPRLIEPMERFRALSALSPKRRAPKSREAPREAVYAALLKDLAPPSLLISPERELLFAFGAMRRFLMTPEGVGRLDVADMCDAALRTPLVAGVDRVARDKKPITFSQVELRNFPVAGMLVDLHLRPVVEDDAVVSILATVVESPGETLGPPPAALAAEIAEPRAAELAVEVLRAREALQATIEELETSNEQLKAANEELLSSNEELQSTNEELSSLNEELHYVNAEHARQNNELVRLTRDFDALLHATEVGVLFLDEQLNISRFTKLIAELFHFNDSDVGRPLNTFRSPFGDIHLEKFLLRAMRMSAPEEVEATDSALRPWLLRAVCYPDRKGVVLSIINVSRMREASGPSADLRQRMFNTAAAFGGDALVVIDLATLRCLFANRRAFLEYGLPETAADEVEISRITPEWGNSAWVNWLANVHLGESAHRLDVQVINAKGAIAAVDLQATVFLQENRTCALIRVLENHGRSEALRELQERARNFAVSNRELEQFASVVAHDLRAPLRHMSQFVEFLGREIAEVKTQKAGAYIEIIRNSSSAMTNMVERLLDYARIGVGALKPSRIDLAECLARVAEVAQAECPDATIRVPTVGAGELVGDPVLITRLFLNLLQNALKFGRVGVTPEIDVEAMVDGEYVVAAVADNGPGVAPDKADDIFKMFTRLHADHEADGYGMGLAICRRICESQRGTIVLDKTYAKGARFVIRLPRALPSEEAGGAS